MNGDERQKKLHVLASKIRQGIVESGISTLDCAEMASIWQEDGLEIPDAEKRMRVKNFASQFGFAVMIDFDLSRAVFIVAN